MKTLREALHKHQLTECKDAEPKECPEAEVPQNGGLICIPFGNKRYCKPMCNHGYDFGFIRISRLYEECSKETKYKWTTQYVGGNRLAVCDESSIQISGAKTAYFPKDQDCLVTKANKSLRNSVMDVFASELKNKGVVGDPQHACFICG
ncbi:uncharacterized protein si:ch1073-126c3.2 [Thalassophryne amazonica]|uniref:uncharacterized protein si:ch1073-126c3.2 n=1 Tax=Thalassophryne amazonica TaxID=390379 RepID=UPI001471EFDB|nr:uncharacterized protein si:ch1073-126c3.2 [Thalassophryne amazonica]